MYTMYVTSTETNEIVATITGDDQDKIQETFMTQYGPNEYENSYTDQGATYASNVAEIEI